MNKGNEIVFKNFTKRHKNTSFALENISFNIPRGSFCGLIGPNGAGKTTILKSIVGIYASYSFSGQININGTPHFDNEVKRRLHYIPEKAKFESDENALSFMRNVFFLNGKKWSTAKKEAKKIIEDFKLKPKQRINKMSSGEQKKILLLQALSQKPELLILDEPMANLDPLVRVEIFEFLKEMNKNGTTIIITSHELLELEEYITYVIIINEGKILRCSPINEIVSKKHSKDFSEKSSLKKVFLSEVERSKNE